VLPLFGSGMHY